MKSGKKYIFYSHLNSDNRGCEAITRSTCKILGCSTENTYMFSTNKETDSKNGLDKFGTLCSVKKLESFAALPSRIIRKVGINQYAVSGYRYGHLVNTIDNQTVCLSTGGDLYCYANMELLSYLQNKAKKRNAKTILWGSSIERSRLTRKIINELKAYDLITVRESLTANTLYEFGIEENVRVYPDPAFVLEPEVCTVPDCFQKNDVVGLNISNYVNGGWDSKSVFMTNVYNLIRHILDTTNMEILLVPHVFWQGQDDRILLNELYTHFKASNRIYMLNNNLNCCQLKYLISKCRFYMGARTHSMIAAYSTCVSSIALGYSVKSKGIATDLFGDAANYVIDCKKIDSDRVLVNAFELLNEREIEIKLRLENMMPVYSARAYDAQQSVAELIS